MRSLSFSKLKTSASYDNMAYAMDPSHIMSPAAHSRNSSAASAPVSPITSTASARSHSHSRFPSTASSLTTVPDSPTLTASKMTLHDLVEEPLEQEESVSSKHAPSAMEEPLCICDESFCEHQRPSRGLSMTQNFPEWFPDDDYFADSRRSRESSVHRRPSVEASLNNLTARWSRHVPSMPKRRWPGRKSSTSLSETTIRSAPLSRASSMKQSPTRRSTMTHTSTEALGNAVSAWTSAEVNERLRRGSTRTVQPPMEIEMPTGEFDPSQRPEPVSTPLLPPMIAPRSTTASTENLGLSLHPPAMSRMESDPLPSFSRRVASERPTPSLSSKVSHASIRNQRDSGNFRQPSFADGVPQCPPTRSSAADSSYQIPLTDDDDDSIWSARLGHANFHILPAPYYPAIINRQTCQRLLDDWESARGQYMRLAADLACHHGPTSAVFAMANEKWAGIDAQWREAHREAFQAVASAALDEAAHHGHDDTLPAAASSTHQIHPDDPLTLAPKPFVFQSLAETPSCSLPAPEDAYAEFILPSDEDQTNGLRNRSRTTATAKFPAVAASEMVGPMVQYAAKIPNNSAAAAGGGIRRLPGGTSLDEERDSSSSYLFNEKRGREKRSRGCIPLPAFSGAREVLAGAFRWKTASAASSSNPPPPSLTSSPSPRKTQFSEKMPW